VGVRYLSGRIIYQLVFALDGGGDLPIVGFGIEDTFAETLPTTVQKFQQREPRETAGVRRTGIIMMDRGEDVDEGNIFGDHPLPSLAWELDKERNSQGRVVEGRTVIEELVMVIEFFSMVGRDDDQRFVPLSPPW
jgi:hypothetical protein